MEELIQRATNFKDESLIGFQQLALPNPTIPNASSCFGEANPNVLSRCTRKLYDNKSNVIPAPPVQQETVPTIKAFNEA